MIEKAKLLEQRLQGQYPNRMTIALEDHHDYCSLTIVPKLRAQNCLEVTIEIDDSSTVTVTMGKACTFDIPEAFDETGQAYILKLVGAGINTAATEVVTYFRSKPASSRLELMVDGHKELHVYKKSLFIWSTNKKHFSYDPYPLASANNI